MRFHLNSTAMNSCHPATSKCVAEFHSEIPAKSKDAYQAVGLVIQEWIRTLELRRHSLRTLRLYRTALGDLGRYLHKRSVSRVQDLDQACLNGWRSGTGLAAGWPRPHKPLISASPAKAGAGWLNANGRVFINPAAGFVCVPPNSPADGSHSIGRGHAPAYREH